MLLERGAIVTLLLGLGGLGGAGWATVVEPSFGANFVQEVQAMPSAPESQREIQRAAARRRQAATVYHSPSVRLGSSGRRSYGGGGWSGGK